MNTKEGIAQRVYNKPFKELCKDRKRIVLTMLKLGDIKNEKYIEIYKSSFSFSKWILAIILFTALIFKIKELVIISLIMFLLDGFFPIKANFLIMFFDNTFGKINKLKKEFVDIDSVKFANKIGAIINFIALILIYLINFRIFNIIGWIVVFLLGIAKIAGALGFCGGMKLYFCMKEGCCLTHSPKK